jgi:hypothetical protein
VLLLFQQLRCPRDTDAGLMALALLTTLASLEF